MALLDVETHFVAPGAREALQRDAERKGQLA
jgi:hypothetical protein